MKRIGNFLKATLIGGVVVLLPVILIYLILAEVLELAVVMATPIADLFPAGSFDKVHLPVVVALFLIVGVSFVLGLLLLAGPGRAAGNWIERRVLGPLPGYRVVKSLTKSLGNVDGEESFKPALLRSQDGSREIIYVIENHDDGQATVMIPQTPTAMTGRIRIVDQDHIEPLNASLAEVTAVLGHWGLGTRELLAANKATDGSGQEKSIPERNQS